MAETTYDLNGHVLKLSNDTDAGVWVQLTGSPVLTTDNDFEYQAIIAGNNTVYGFWYDSHGSLNMKDMLTGSSWGLMQCSENDAPANCCWQGGSIWYWAMSGNTWQIPFSDGVPGTPVNQGNITETAVLGGIEDLWAITDDGTLYKMISGTWTVQRNHNVPAGVSCFNATVPNVEEPTASMLIVSCGNDNTLRIFDEASGTVSDPIYTATNPIIKLAAAQQPLNLPSGNQNDSTVSIFVIAADAVGSFIYQTGNNACSPADMQISVFTTGAPMDCAFAGSNGLLYVLGGNDLQIDNADPVVNNWTYLSTGSQTTTFLANSNFIVGNQSLINFSDSPPTTSSSVTLTMVNTPGRTTNGYNLNQSVTYVGSNSQSGTCTVGWPYYPHNTGLKLHVNGGGGTWIITEIDMDPIALKK